ncbi:o-succinylbenzoate--CoA ligase [Cellulomonas soli]|uniref:o-succinylbenzoate--CoA ligase n=1 Tax=Cellulomonas soli TaxID=931535 RepID=UPI003F86F48C
MSRPLREVPCAASLSATEVDALIASLAAALDGSGPALSLVDPADAGPTRSASPTVPDDVALVVRTSGSTGAPRKVMLGAEALRASAEATAARLAGPGHWLLTLPVTHVAGLQVLVRSLLAGTRPTVPVPGPFRAAAFVDAVGSMTGPGPRYVSLVPTQLRRLLDDGAALDALRQFDAVLLGGAASPEELLARARGAGVAVVTTYGMSETCGGCVYDGVPLDGVHVGLEADGRIRLTGPVLAAGYLGEDDTEVFVAEHGARSLRTSDLGTWQHGRLVVLGRADDVLVTGGVKVAPAPVESLLSALPGVAEVCVVGVEDAEWGQAVVAVVVPSVGSALPGLERARDVVSAALGPASAPRHVLQVPALPRRGPGKTDRRAVAALAARLLDRPPHVHGESPTPRSSL